MGGRRQRVSDGKAAEALLAIGARYPEEGVPDHSPTVVRPRRCGQASALPKRQRLLRSVFRGSASWGRFVNVWLARL